MHFLKLAGIKLLEAHDGTTKAQMKIEKAPQRTGNSTRRSSFTLADLTLRAAVHSVGGEHKTMSPK